MANLLPRDEELFKRIETDHIRVDPALWNVIYQYVGDPILVINLLVRSFTDDQQPLPKEEAKKILDYTSRIIEVMDKLYQPENIGDEEKDPLLREIKAKNLKLDPVTDELFRNYIRNDIYMVNLIVGDYVDPVDPREVVSFEDSKKILGYINKSRQFMDRLRRATAQKEAY